MITGRLHRHLIKTNRSDSIQTIFLSNRGDKVCHLCSDCRQSSFLLGSFSCVMTAKIMYSMGQGCHPALRVHKQAIGFMHYVSHHNEVVCSIQGIRVLAMIRIIAAIADVTPAPLIDATHIFSKPVHDFILFQGIMKTVFFFLKNTIAPCRGCDLLYHSICFNRFSKDIVPYHRSCP